MDNCCVYLLSASISLEDPKMIGDLNLYTEDVQPLILKKSGSNGFLLTEEISEKQSSSHGVGITISPTKKRKVETIQPSSPKRTVVTIEKEHNQSKLILEKKEKLDKLLTSLRSEASLKCKEFDRIEPLADEHCPSINTEFDRIEPLVNGHCPSIDSTYLLQNIENMIDEKLKKQKQDIELILERNQKDLLLNISNILQMMTHAPPPQQRSSQQCPSQQQLPHHRPFQPRPTKHRLQQLSSPQSFPTIYQPPPKQAPPQLTPTSYEPTNLVDLSLSFSTPGPSAVPSTLPQNFPVPVPGDSPQTTVLMTLPTLQGRNGESIEAPQILTPQRHVAKIVSLFKDEEKTLKLNREQWARKMTLLIFNRTELAMSNISGTLGNKKLNEEKIIYLRKILFNKFPCATDEDEAATWKMICSVVNEVHRNVKKYEKKKLNPPSVVKIERPSHVFDFIDKDLSGERW